MKLTHFLIAGVLFFTFVGSLHATSRSSPSWDPPKKVDENTIFFGEKERAPHGEHFEPAPGDKSYPWYLLEKGNNFLLAGHLEKAAAAFAKCYEVGGPTRVLSGFKWIETDKKLGRLNEAIAVLEEMKQKYLVSTKEFGEATLVRAELEDEKRKLTSLPKPVEFTGREWLFKLQAQRMKDVLRAMEILRAHDVPLKEPAQKVAYRLDEYFIAHPEEPADDPAEILARILYELDPDSRLPIDRWRLSMSSESGARSLVPPTPNYELPAQLTGAEWVRWTHNDKMDYVLGAMEMLKSQNIPMQKSPYAYEFAMDRLFTDKPELSASDSVVTLASILYESEPEAREVLEALRLE